MTTEIDPIRWTASPDEAPELLRGPLAAASREGPSPAQMRMLALKLAAVSAGTAITASAATAKASAAGVSTGFTTGAIATVPAATLPFLKLMAAVAVVGVAAWGGSNLLSTPAPARNAGGGAARTAEATRQAATPAPAPVVEQLVAGTELSKPASGDVPDERSAKEVRQRPRAVPSAPPATDEAGPTRTAPLPDAKKSRAAGVIAETKTPAREEITAEQRPARQAKSAPGLPSEVELLRSARAALASRPREAYALTEQHREHYPEGVFSQERDALAIEALLRAGDTQTARRLAERFVSAHPNSPHAHRFRETLGLH